MLGEIILKLVEVLTPEDVRQLKAAGCADEVRAVLRVLEKLTWAWRSTEFEQLDSKVWADLYVKRDKLWVALSEG